MEESKDKKSRNIGLIATIAFHGGIALLFLLLMAWKAPNPPLPEYGVEINIGFSDEGSGDEQIATDPGNEGTTDESATQPTETQPEEVKEETKEEQTQQEVVTEESNPVSVKEKEKVVKEEEVKTKKETAKTTPTEIKKQEVNKEAVFNPNQTIDKTNTQKTGENKSEGDDKNKGGNKGKQGGTPDANLYDGIQGGGGGGNGDGLELNGWNWDKKPDPKLPDNENGVVVFEITVEEDGEIFLRTMTRGLSPEAERICKEEILRRTFTPIGTPKRATGKITISVISK